MKKLTESQESMYEHLEQHGFWYPNCGIVWDSHSGTIRIMEALVKKGFAKEVKPTNRYDQRQWEPIVK